MTDLLVVAFAAWQAVEIWRHSTLTATWRERLTTLDHVATYRAVRKAVGRRRLRIAKLAGRITASLAWWVAPLVACPFCLSPWAAWAAEWALQCGGLPAFLAYGLAAARLANLGNDLSHAYCRTPRFSTTSETPAYEPEPAPDLEPGTDPDATPA